MNDMADSRWRRGPAATLTALRGEGFEVRLGDGLPAGRERHDAVLGAGFDDTDDVVEARSLGLHSRLAHGFGVTSGNQRRFDGWQRLVEGADHEIPVAVGRSDSGPRPSCG
jgi:hypothetical protein